VKLAAENVPQAEIRLMDGQHLPYADREFDLVKTVTVLQHNPDDRRSALIAEICRVARDYVVLFEDTATPRVPGNDGSGLYANYFGRPLDWYVDECKKHGWLLITSKSLATYVSHRTFNLLRGTLSRGRKEGQPLSPMHGAIERRTLPITSRLDRVVPSRQWELTMMMFRGTWREY
jgi:SAM-dependent methyltransferase